MVEARSPFQGLGFYTEDDARWFFGRTTERKIILAHLRTARLTLLYAESGVGKSSLLRAGVAARLRELAMQNIDASRSPKFVPLVFSAWKDDPVQDLISEIRRQVHMLRPATNGTGPEPASNGSLAEAIAAAGSALDATLVIILDQFEEHFSYRLSAGRPDRLADELARCVNSPTVPANFLIAVREDAYGGLGDLFSGRISNVYNNYLHLEYLAREAALEAIEKPVEIYNAEHPDQEPIALDEDLADAVLDEVKRGNIELGTRRPDRDGGSWPTTNADEIETPFLQLVMSRLWECELAKGSRVLRTETLNDELGGAETIVRNHVDRALMGLAGEELEAATDIFHDLVTPSGVKVAHTARDLAQMSAHSETTVGAVLDRLYEERIVRAVDPAPGSGQARYEIFHDRLAAPILDWRQQRENARLDRARERAEQEAEVQRTQARRFKRRARIMFALAIGLLVLLVAVAVLLGYARRQSDTAKREKTAALKGTAEATYFGLTARATSQLSSRPDVSLLLYLAASNKVTPSGLTGRNIVATLDAFKSSGAFAVLHGHTDAVESIAFNRSGSTLASASGDGTVRLWRVGSGSHYPLGAPLRANGPLYSVAFDPSGGTLASGSVNRIILWNVGRHVTSTVVPDASGAITSVAYSLRGSLLAAGGSDGTVMLRNTTTGRHKTLNVASRGLIRSVAFSPNGQQLAASSNKSVELFDVTTGRRLGQPLTTGKSVVYALAYSRDGRTLAAGGSGGQIVFYDPTTRKQSRPSLSGMHIVNSLAFSADGKTLVAGGASATVLWDLAQPTTPPARLQGHHGAVNTVAFSPDGTTLASAGADRTITLWRYPVGPLGQPLAQLQGAAAQVAASPDGSVIASGGPTGQIYLIDRSTREMRVLHHRVKDPIGQLAFDPAGRTLAAGYGDDTIVLWDVASGKPIKTLRGNTASVLSLAFDHTGTTMVSGGTDGTVRLWNVHTGTEIGQPLRAGLGAVYAVAFSPDGRSVAGGGDGRVIRLWSTRTDKPLGTPIAQENAVFGLAFSPDGHTLASGGADDTIHLWRIGSHSYDEIAALTGHTDFVRSLAFSPDGTTLASGGTDDTVRLWDVETGTELGAPLTGDTKSVESVAFVPHSGGLLVSGSSDGTVRLWQAESRAPTPAQLRPQVCSFVGAGLSRMEWSQYAPDIPFEQTCPHTTPS